MEKINGKSVFAFIDDSFVHSALGETRTERQWIAEEYGIPVEDLKTVVMGYMISSRIQFFDGYHYGVVAGISDKEVQKVLRLHYEMFDGSDRPVIYNGLIPIASCGMFPPVLEWRDNKWQKIIPARRALVPAFLELVQSADTHQYHTGENFINELLASRQDGISVRQAVISFTKWMHGFNVSDPEKDLQYLRGEVDEAEEALLYKTPEDFVEELADVAIYCYGIAQMLDLDLDKAIDKKIKYNLTRVYDGEQ